MSIAHCRKHINLCRLLSKILYNRRCNLFSATTSKEYIARKLVGYSQNQMYTVVSDVQHYQEFVPFCTKSLIVREGDDHLLAKLEIGFPPIVESYTSYVKFIKPSFVSAQCRDGTLFNYLETTWNFSPGLKSNERTCIVDFYIRFEFKSLVYSQVAIMFFEKLVQQMEWAFISEAKRRYGRESVPSHKLTPPRNR